MINYYTISDYNQLKFGERIQKIPINAGFTCPNRDGKISYNGCIYCNNDSFSPFYANEKRSIFEQLNNGVKFYQKRYQCNKFLAYFQSFTNTYDSVQNLNRKYNEALSHPNISGIVIGTRPDCINNDIINLLNEYKQKTYVRIELGVESFDDDVLNAINRGHKVCDTIEALKKLDNANIETCIHLIFGLPKEKKDFEIKSANIINETSIKFVKLHHLQVIKDSVLEKLYKSNQIELKLHTLESYINSVYDFLSHLKKKVYIERFINRVPMNLLVAPKWGNIDETKFRELLNKKFKDDQL